MTPNDHVITAPSSISTNMRPCRFLIDDHFLVPSSRLSICAHFDLNVSLSARELTRLDQHTSSHDTKPHRLLQMLWDSTTNTYLLQTNAYTIRCLSSYSTVTQKLGIDKLVNPRGSHPFLYHVYSLLSTCTSHSSTNVPVITP